MRCTQVVSRCSGVAPWKYPTIRSTSPSSIALTTNAIPPTLGTARLHTMKRIVVRALALADEAVDEVLYRPAVVKAFMWLPRWWLCDLAKLSMRLDEHWAVGYWSDAVVPGGLCEACGRRAAIHVYEVDWLERRTVRTCGWCHLTGPLVDESDVQRELALARAHSIGWRWRWTIRP